jgi:hypothetical protein
MVYIPKIENFFHTKPESKIIQHLHKMTPRTNNRKKVFNLGTADVEEKIEIKTLHFNFTEQMTQELTVFADTHKNDDRKSFKSAWLEWLNTNAISSLVETEIQTQTQKGFTGDILDKMFTSVRYYFRKKLFKAKPEKHERKQYISLCPIFLAEIDKHALSIIKENIVKSDSDKNLSNISPAKAYANFCETNQEPMYAQIEHLVDLLEYTEICEKMKKTYKNRFHLMKTNVENMYV